MRQVTIVKEHDIILPSKRRVGRPRIHWTNDTMMQAYDKLVQENRYDKITRDKGYNTIIEARALHNLAQNRRKWKDDVVYRKDKLNRTYAKNEQTKL